jgi:branched-chain amino acid transport system substrate-binding protein
MSTAEGAVAAFDKLIHQDKVPAILGVWTSEVAKSVFPIAQENQVVAFSPVVVASGLTAIGDFIFRASHSADVLIPGGVKVTQEKLGYQRVAMIVDMADEASRSSDEVYRKTCADNGIEVLTTETFETGETDFSTQLTRIKALDPDAIFLSAQQIEIIKILIQGRELGIPTDIPFISLVLSIDEVQSAGNAAEGAITFTDWVSTADTPGNQAFVQNYTAKYGMEPSVWAAQPYAAVYILAEAIKNAQSTDSAAIAAALAEIKDFDTILGKFSFNAIGDAVYDPVVLIVKNGKLEVFE